jgi:hypothetical protein
MWGTVCVLYAPTIHTIDLARGYDKGTTSTTVVITLDRPILISLFRSRANLRARRLRAIDGSIPIDVEPFEL